MTSYKKAVFSRLACMLREKNVQIREDERDIYGWTDEDIKIEKTPTELSVSVPTGSEIILTEVDETDFIVKYRYNQRKNSVSVFAIDPVSTRNFFNEVN